MIEDWFDAPRWVGLAAAAPLVWLVGRASVRARERGRARVLGSAHAPQRAASRAVPLLAALAFVAAVLACARPRFGAPTVPLSERGVDLVVALDVSRSMLARDARPSRLGAARRELADLARSGRTARLALVVFAGEARTLAPPTRDTGAVLELARSADPELDLVGGSDLSAALVEAEELLARRRASNADAAAAAVVLLTDGEDHGGSARAVAERLARADVPVHVIGIGSERGAKIPIDGGTRYLTDARGDDVVTALDPASLGALAAAGGGTYRRASDDAGAALALAREELSELAARAHDLRSRRERTQRFQWFAVAALLLSVAALRPARGGRR